MHKQDLEEEPNDGIEEAEKHEAGSSRGAHCASPELTERT